jgi:hypothetical protein
MSGHGHRQKGDRIEREIVGRYRILVVDVERYPLSGASRFFGSGHDANIDLLGADMPAPVNDVNSSDTSENGEVCHDR